MMEIKLDLKQIERDTGKSFESLTHLFLYVRDVLEWLKNHNKNYTKEQYFKIDELFDFVSAVKFAFEEGKQ